MLLWGVQSVVFACNKCKIGMRKRQKESEKTLCSAKNCLHLKKNGQKTMKTKNYICGCEYKSAF